MFNNDEIEVGKTNFKMLDICQECGRIYYKPLIFTCSHCDSKLIEVDYRIAEVIMELIKLGYVVSWTYMDTYRDHNEKRSGTLIFIYFDEKYPDSLFGELPPEWYISEYNMIKEENGPEISLSVLICDCYHDGNEPSDNDINFDIKVTTSNMVTWLKEKDMEGNRAMLLLSGCRLGGNRINEPFDKRMTLEEILDLVSKE